MSHHKRNNVMRIWHDYSLWLVRHQIVPCVLLNSVSIEIYANKTKSFDVDNMMYVKPIVDALKQRLIFDDNSKNVKKVSFEELVMDYKENKMLIVIKENV